MHRLPQGKLQISASNQGSAHVQIIDFDLDFGSPNGRTHVGVVKYVLPGSTMSWTVTAPTMPEGTLSAHIHGSSDRGEFSFDAPMEAARP